jgi:hypothetical protein
VTIPVAHVDYEATIGVGPLAASREVDGWGLGDIVPRAQLGWQYGEFAHTIYLQAVTPTDFWKQRSVSIWPNIDRQFCKFVEATHHVNFAEIAADPRDYPGAPPHMLKAGSLVFSPHSHQDAPHRRMPAAWRHAGRPQYQLSQLKEKF